MKSPKHARVGPGGVSIAVSGFLLVDSLLQPIYANDEAIRILAYPQSPRKVRPLGTFLARRLRSILREQERDVETRPAELTSGRRRYLCRSFSVKPRGKNSMQPALALLLERNRPRAVDLHEFAERFRLTRREREAVELLMRGFTSKEIAARMNISVNTVKAFLRLVMLKTSVSTRSGIIGKVFHQEPGQGLPRFPAEASRAG